MLAFIEKTPQILAGATFLVLVLAIIHELAYFAVVGPQFQSAMTATDYFVSALAWMPLVVIVLLGTGLLLLTLTAWRGDLSHEEAKRHSARYRRATFFMDALFGPAAACGITASVLLFGNPYDLRAAGGLASIGAISFFFWLRRFEVFARVLTPAVAVFSGFILGLILYSYLEGRADGYFDLTKPGAVFKLKLAAAPGEASVSLLRLLNDGVLVRSYDGQTVFFLRWDAVRELSRQVEPPDPRSLMCRLFAVRCLTEAKPSASSPQSPNEQPAPNEKEKEGSGGPG
jgi:hypothetical protein